MTTALHTGLAAGRWQELSLAEQVANIGSEVGRAALAKAAGNEQRMTAALDRCLELFDLTIADDRWRGRRREIARAREIVCDFLVGDNVYASTAESLDAYFLPFAAAVRNGTTSPGPSYVDDGSGFDDSELLLAETVVYRFLSALRTRDEATLRNIVYRPSVLRWEVGTGGISATFLAQAQIADEELESLGIVHTARILPRKGGEPDLVAFGLVTGSRASIITSPIQARAIALIQDAKAWKIWGSPEPSEFAQATLVPLPIPAPVRDEMLSIVGSEWLMALEPHLTFLTSLQSPADEVAVMASPTECAHSLASVAMAVFAIESLAARLVATGRLVGDSITSLLDSVADANLRRRLTELLVLRNVISHNHVWRIQIELDPSGSTLTQLGLSPIVGNRNNARYRVAVDSTGWRTKILNLHLVPTAIRASDVFAALPVAVNTFDHIARLDVPNMRTLADHPLRIGGHVSTLRQLAVRHAT